MHSGGLGLDSIISWALLIFGVLVILAFLIAAPAPTIITLAIVFIVLRSTKEKRRGSKDDTK